mgnify:CR=1 FL=1
MKPYNVAVHFDCLKEKKWLVLFIVTLEQLMKTYEEIVKKNTFFVLLILIFNLLKTM